MSNVSKYLIIIILTASVTLLLTLGIVSKDDQKRGHGKDSVRIGLKWLNQAQFAGIYVSHDKGFYNEAGIDVEWFERKFGTSTVDLVMNGEVDLGLVSPGDFFEALNKKKDIVAVAAFFQYSPTVLISPKSKNIRTAEDLIGKRIGVIEGGDEPQLIVKALLAAAEIPLESVEFKIIERPFSEVFAKNEVDTIPMYQTDTFDLTQAGIKYSELLPEKYGVDLYNDILIVRRDYLEKNKELVGTFISATVQGLEYARDNEDEAVEIVLKYDNEEFHSVERESFILKTLLPFMQPRKGLSFGRMTPGQWDHTYDFFRQEGLVRDLEIFEHVVPGYYFD